MYKIKAKPREHQRASPRNEDFEVPPGPGGREAMILIFVREPNLRKRTPRGLKGF